MTTPSFLDVLEEIATEVVGPAAADIDATGAFPRAAVDRLGQAGLLGLISSTDVGGHGPGHGRGRPGRTPPGHGLRVHGHGRVHALLR